MAAIFTGAERHPFRIGVGLAHVGGGRAERVIAEFARRLLHDRAGHAHRQRLVGIFVLPRPFEHIAAVDLPAAQIAGLPGHPEQLFEAVVIGFELVIGDRKILISAGIASLP
jgi:hypothetical protein